MKRFKFDLNRKLNKIVFIKTIKDIILLDSYSGSSCNKKDCGQKNYFLKVINGNVVKSVLENYERLKGSNNNIAKMIECNYVKEENSTYIVYEFLKGETLKQKISTLSYNEITIYSEKLTMELTKLIMNNSFALAKEDIVKKYIKVLEESTKQIEHYQKNNIIKSSYFFNLKKLKKVYTNLLDKVKENEIYFVHSDLNLSNIMIYENEVYLLDIEDACFNYMGYHFKCLCWWFYENYEYKKKYLYFYNNVIQKLEIIFKKDLQHEIFLGMIYEYLHRIIRYKGNDQQIDYTLLKLSKLIKKMA